jgi:hypothetical protein
MMGGHDFHKTFDTLYRYDTVANTWTLLSPLPSPLQATTCVSTGGKIYVPGGGNLSAAPQVVLYIYDILTDTWSIGSPPPLGRLGYGLFLLDGKLYRVGGCTGGICPASNDVSVYHIATDTWTSAAPYPTTISWEMCGAIEGYGYCVGGVTNGQAGTHKGYRYDPATDTWSDAAVADFPSYGPDNTIWGSGTGVERLSGGPLQLAVFGGRVNHSTMPTNRAWYFTPGVGGGTWTEFQSMPSTYFRNFSAAGGGNLHAIPQAYNFMYIAPPMPTPNRCASIPPDPYGYRCDDTVSRPWITATWPVDWSNGMATLPLYFTFQFYGDDYTEVNADPSGNLQFTTSDSEYANVCLPDPTLGKMIAAFWDDLYLGGGGAGHYSLTGVAPNRVLTVEWRDLPHFPGSPSGVTFQVQLEETTNDIYILYRDVDFGDPVINGGASATVGIQNAASSYAVQYSCNAPVLAPGRAIRFYRGATPTPSPSPTGVIIVTGTPTATPSPLPPNALAPVDDAYIALVNPNTPYGATDPSNLVSQASRGISGPCVTTRQTLLKFDVSGLAGDVTSATLTLQRSQYTGPSAGVIIGVWPIHDTWDELTVTWNTRPISDGAPLSTRSSPIPPVNLPLVFPSTAALASYVNSQRPARGGDGLASFITGYSDCPTLSAPQLQNASKENPINLPPRLDIAVSYRLYLPLALRQ